MSVVLTLGRRSGICHLTHPFPLHFGGTLDGPSLLYEIQGPPGAPVVIVQGGISSGRHVSSNDRDPRPGWWESVAGPHRAIDTSQFRVVGVDFLADESGAGGGAVVTSHDQARAVSLVLDRLGVERAFAIVGCSYGGMVALAFAAGYRERAERIVAISAAHRSHPAATAYRCIQRRILTLGAERGFEAEAVALARSLGMITYRGHAELAARFDGEPVGSAATLTFPVEDYLASRGRAFARAFSARRYYSLSLAIDAHRVRPEDILTPLTLAGFDSDQLVPIAQMRELARRAGGNCKLHELSSPFGHDAFLKETELIANVLSEVLDAPSRGLTAEAAR